MRLRLLLSLSLAPVLSIFAQQPIAAIPGDEPTIALYSRLAEHAGRLIPMLAQMKTEVWVAKGASETYVQQTTSVTVQLQAVQHDMRSLQQHLDSVLSGLRRYQNPALADLIVSVAGEDTPDLQQLENHLVEIAAQKDKEYTVVEREAQRCRGMLVREPVPAPRPIRKIP